MPRQDEKMIELDVEGHTAQKLTAGDILTDSGIRKIVDPDHYLFTIGEGITKRMAVVSPVVDMYQLMKIKR